MTETVLRPLTDGDAHIVESFSGPDESGRIAYLHGMMRTTVLKLIRFDGSGDEVVFTNTGGFADIGILDLSLAPRGGLVAFVRKADKGVQFPGAYVEQGAFWPSIR